MVDLRFRAVSLAVAVLGFAVAGCGGDEGDAAPDGTVADLAGDLRGTRWVFVAVDGPDDFTYAADGLVLELGADGQFVGPQVCNSTGGPWSIDGSTLTFPETMSTAMGCMDPDVNEAESLLFDLFSGTATAKVTGDELVVHDAGTSASFVAG